MRCAWRGIARTAQQRESAIRYWLQILPADPISDITIVEALFAVVLDTLDPDYRETAKANFLAIARGGEFMDYLFLVEMLSVQWFERATVRRALAGEDA